MISILIPYILEQTMNKRRTKEIYQKSNNNFSFPSDNRTMCWDYSDCGSCGERTYCITQCWCDDDDESCPHRDCKSFEKCHTCYQDLCDECFEDKCPQCGFAYCEECDSNNEEHTCVKPN
jgi:hypothetical protein